MFCVGPNFLSQPRNLTTFSASSKTFVPAQKTILLNANQLFVWHKMFVTATICKLVSGLTQKNWTSPKHFGTCKRTRHKTLVRFTFKTKLLRNPKINLLPSLTFKLFDLFLDLFIFILDVMSVVVQSLDFAVDLEKTKFKIIVKSQHSFRQINGIDFKTSFARNFLLYFPKISSND